MIFSTAFKLIAITAGLNFTEHVGHCDGCNEVNPSIQAHFSSPVENLEFGLGVYHNSFDKLGLTAGVSWYPTEYLFADVALVTGYEEQTGFPLTIFGRAGVQARYDFVSGRLDRTQGLGVQAFAFPSLTKAKRPALGLGLNFNYRIKF